MIDENPDAVARQRVERYAGARRSRLTPVPGTDTTPEAPVSTRGDAPAAPSGGPDDERLRRDRPPHWG